MISSNLTVYLWKPVSSIWASILKLMVIPKVTGIGYSRDWKVGPVELQMVVSGRSSDIDESGTGKHSRLLDGIVQNPNCHFGSYQEMYGKILMVW